MLSNLDSHTMIAATDLARAKEFYKDKLGLTPFDEISGSLIFKGPNSSRFFFFASPLAGTAKNAVMGWKTKDITAEVSHLKSRGVVFEENNLPNFKTVDSIVTAPSGRSAWFKDGERNMLGLVQWSP